MLYEKAADENGHLLFDRYDATALKAYTPMPHFHSSIELYLCTEGKYTVYINGETYTLTAGDIAFVDKFVPHTSGTLEGDEAGTVYVVVASSAYLDGIKWLSDNTLTPYTPARSGYEKIAELVAWAYELKNEMNEEMRYGFVSLLLGMMREHCGCVARGTEKNTKLLVNVMRYIDEHYTEKISMSMLAKTFGYEQTYLSRIFNKFLGMNLREYLNRRRVAALQKLRRSDPSLPIWKAAESCGFDSPNTYYRAIEKYSNKNHIF